MHCFGYELYSHSLFFIRTFYMLFLAFHIPFKQENIINDFYTYVNTYDFSTVNFSIPGKAGGTIVII